MAESAARILDRLSRIYWEGAAGRTGSSPLRLHGYAMDVADFAAMAQIDHAPGNWEAVYDIWLGRASQHALQAQALGRE